MDDSCIIVHDSGWACSNSAGIDIESDVIVGEDGMNPKIVQKKTLKAQGLFNVEGNLLVGFNVRCVIKGSDGKTGFTGIARQVGNLTTIDLTGVINDTKSIIKNIK